MSEKLTHKDLVNIGYRWLLKHSSCSFAVKEFKFASSYGEQPDVIGFWGCASVLLEAKCSRSDFLADRKKSFRINPETGMGKYRFMIVPKGLISKEDLPFNWGLIEVDEFGFAHCTHKQYNEYFQGVPRCDSHTNGFEKYNVKDERNLFYSIIRRLKPKF